MDTISITLSPYIYIQNFMVLFDPSVEEVGLALMTMRRCFIFIFVTKSPDDMIDYSNLPNNPYVMTPLYTGNFKESDIRKIVIQIVSNFLLKDFL